MVRWWAMEQNIKPLEKNNSNDRYLTKPTLTRKLKYLLAYGVRNIDNISFLSMKKIPRWNSNISIFLPIRKIAAKIDTKMPKRVWYLDQNPRIGLLFQTQWNFNFHDLNLPVKETQGCCGFYSTKVKPLFGTRFPPKKSP